MYIKLYRNYKLRELLEKSSKNLLRSHEKCHLPFSSREKINMETGDLNIKNGICERILEVHFDKRLTFDYYIPDLCEKVRKKKSRVSQYTKLLKRKMLMNFFFDL